MHGSGFYRIKNLISSLNPPFSLLPSLLPPAAWMKPRSSRSVWTKLRPWHRSELARAAVPAAASRCYLRPRRLRYFLAASSTATPATPACVAAA
uniref:Uncharacterized protein n=1 Tax=Setaria italica TaxID=4555 RepID=K3XTW8_SETIT